MKLITCFECGHPASAHTSRFAPENVDFIGCSMHSGGLKCACDLTRDLMLEPLEEWLAGAGEAMTKICL